MKILLLNPFMPKTWHKEIIRIPNFFVNPYDLTIITSILRNSFDEVIILDANILRLNLAKTLSKIQNIKPDVLIMTTASIDRWQCPIPSDDYFLPLLKNITCEKIVYGPHITINPNKYISYSDKIIIGEPESHFPEIITNKQKLYENKSVKNLDCLPFPAYDLLPIKRYRNISVVTSRGCPFKCIFCYKGLWGDNYRTRSVSNVIEELKLLKYKHRINHITFWDLEFTLYKERTIALCKEIIKQNLKINWSANARATTLDYELVHMMKRAGCDTLNIGIESGNNKTLTTIKKGITLELARNAVNLARKAGIKFIYTGRHIGFPYETLDDINDSTRFFMSIKCDNIFCSALIPYPGTELNRMGKIGSDWNKVVKYTGRVANKINIKRALRYVNLNLFLHKITLDIYGLMRYILKQLTR